VKQPKTFEQLLAEEMAKGTRGGIIAEKESPSKQIQNGSSTQKKDFLKRKTQTLPPKIP